MSKFTCVFIGMLIMLFASMADDIFFGEGGAKNLMNQAIERGYAEYDSQTGKWGWLAKKEDK